MTIAQLAEKLDAKFINCVDPDRQINCGYAGDFLSFVIGNAPSGCAWFTIMNNLNVCAVATLAEVAVIVLCEGVTPDDALLEKVRAQEVNLIATKSDVFTAIKKVAGYLGE